MLVISYYICSTHQEEVVKWQMADKGVVLFV